MRRNFWLESRSKKLLFKSGILAVVVCLQGFGLAQTYVGAEGALREIKTAPATVAKKAEPGAVLELSVAQYKRRAGKLSKSQSAKEWLALADRAPATGEQWVSPSSNTDAVAFGRVMSALPSPGVWPEIEHELHVRTAKPRPSPKDLALLALFETLRGERDQAWLELGILNGLSPGQQGVRGSLFVDLATLSGRNDQIEVAYRRLAVALSPPNPNGGWDKSIKLPDLYAILGEAPARALVRDVLESFDGELVIDGSPNFRDIARNSAIAIIGKLKHPQWTLASDTDGAPLFEALHKRFPDVEHGIQGATGFNNDSYSAAATRYVIYLVTNGRAGDAASFAKSQESAYWLGTLADEDVALLRRRDKIESFLRFLETVIADGADSSATRTYVDLCGSVDQAGRANSFIAKLPASKRTWLADPTERAIDAALENGDAESAGSLLFNLLLHAPESEGFQQLHQGAPSELYNIGRALNRQDYIDLAFSAAEKVIRGSSPFFENDWIYLALARAQRGAEAEHLIAESLQREMHDSSSGTVPKGQTGLENLANVYAAAGRYRDVVDLLDLSPNWGVSDLAFLEDPRKRDRSLPFIAAQALAAVGRGREAVRVLGFVLQSQPDLDQAYALFLKLDPLGLGSLLDTMHRVSPMATRPLIWKAELLRLQGRLDDAERTIRKAIELDPQDTKAVDSSTRYQAWEILARIELAEGGKGDEAHNNRLKFESSSKYYWSYDTDWYRDAIGGPKKRIKGLAENPDDFCLRYEMADDLRKAGRRDAANAQVLRACIQLSSELGPGSDINCQGADAEFARISEAELNEEIRKNPGRAADYAVLGDLFETIGENQKAFQNFNVAVRLDPNYLVAWNGLSSLEEKVWFSPALKDRVRLNQVRLAPLAERWPESQVRNFGELWSTADWALRQAPNVAEPVFQLRASTTEWEENNINHINSAREQYWPPSPGSILANDKTIADFIRLIGTLPNTRSAGKGGR